MVLSFLSFTEDIGMGACVKHQQYQFVIMLLPQQQPIGAQMTFPFALIVASKHVSLVLLFKRFTLEESANNCPKLVERQSTLLTPFDVTLELDSHLQFVLIHALFP